MTIGGVQDDQFNFNFTKIYFSKPNLKKNKKIGSRFFSLKIGHPSFFSTANECLKRVFAFSVPRPQKSTFCLKYLSSLGSVNSHWSGKIGN